MAVIIVALVTTIVAIAVTQRDNSGKGMAPSNGIEDAPTNYNTVMLGDMIAMNLLPAHPNPRSSEMNVSMPFLSPFTGPIDENAEQKISMMNLVVT